MKSNWIKVADKLPENGQTVNIKIADGVTRKGILFDAGVFWKMRK